MVIVLHYNIINSFHTATEGTNLVIVYGDEQFVSRLLQLMRVHINFFGNILPFPGMQLMQLILQYHFN